MIVLTIQRGYNLPEFQGIQKYWLSCGLWYSKETGSGSYTSRLWANSV